MNCFDWQNRSSDFLDGTLIGVSRREADEHLNSCKSCHERHSRYLQILSAVSSQPRSALPVPLRKAPFSYSLPRLDIRNTRARWQDTPWFIRTGIEGLGIVTLILSVIAMVPRVRTLYERSMEQKLEGFHTSGLEGEPESPVSAPLVRGKSLETEDDFAGEHEGEDEDLKVGSSEIWRFNLKTDSPYQVRPEIVKVLGELKIPVDTPGFGGIEAPGGIQFDLLVPQSAVPSLKHQLQKLAGPVHSTGTETARVTTVSAEALMAEVFTWYKNKSKRQIPAGKSRVVIWLSQM